MTSTDAPLNVVLYGRVSVDRNGKSVDAQLDWLREWATREGHTVVAEHRDDGVSASRFAKGKARPGWQDTMTAITSGAANAVAVWEASRASRDRSVWAALLGVLVTMRALFIEGGRIHDPSDPDDGFLLDLQAALAGRESAMVQKRVKRGVDANAVAGGVPGAGLFGYRTEYTEGPKGRPVPHRVIDDDPIVGADGKYVRVIDDQPISRAGVVGYIVARMLAGDTSTSIARRLNDAGVPTKLKPRSREATQWTATAVVRVAGNPAYAGIRLHHGKPVAAPAQWDPIVSTDDHRKVTALLADPSRKNTRNGRHRTSLLVGVARCGVCEGPLRILTRGPGKALAYTCRTSSCVGRKITDVDRLVEQVMIGLLEREDLPRKLTADDPAATAATEELARLDVVLDRTRAAVAAGDLDVVDLVEVRKGQAARRDALARALKPAHVPAAVVDTAGPDAAERWSKLDTAAKRAVIGFLADVRILKSGPRAPGAPFDPATVSITPRIP